jgi:hypothetical protein
MVIFTSKQISRFVESLRNARSSTVCKLNQSCFPTMIITDSNTPWEIPPIKQIKDALISQLNMDPQKGIHSSDLYTVWNAKAWMLEYAALQNPFKTACFLWVDAGAFRHTFYRFGSWSNQAKVGQIFQEDGQQKLLLGLIVLCNYTFVYSKKTGLSEKITVIIPLTDVCLDETDVIYNYGIVPSLDNNSILIHLFFRK